MTVDERVTHFSKSREKILGRVTGEDSPCVQGPQSSGKDLVVRNKVPSRTDRISVREPGIDGNHAPVGKTQNDCSSANSQEIPVSMDNLRPEGTKTNLFHLQLEKLWERKSM